jgi:cob(I)alamin adenosyltransferase
MTDTEKWLYSGKGDQGFSSLFNGHRISKGDSVFELIGSLDEANAQIGMAISLCSNTEIRDDLRNIQNGISNLMGIIAGMEKSDENSRSTQSQLIEWLENRINHYGKPISNPQAFIFSGKTTLGAALDVARAVIRRAERIAVKYSGLENNIKSEYLAYLNRLSSLLFILRLSIDSSS